MRFVTVMAGAASASPHGWGHGSGQRSPPMPALKCPTPRSVVSISTTRLDATQKINSGKPLRKRPRVHVRHPSQPGPKGTHCSTGFAIRAKMIEQVRKRLAVETDIETAAVGEIRERLQARRMLLAKNQLAFRTLGRPPLRDP